jgi:hypothetical protein
MEVNSSGQMGQPAAWMMANKALSFENEMHFRARTLAKPHVSGNFDGHFSAAWLVIPRPISTKDVDKFVDYP